MDGQLLLLPPPPPLLQPSAPACSAAPMRHFALKDPHSPFKTWALEPRARTRHSSNGRPAGLPRRIFAVPNVLTKRFGLIGRSLRQGRRPACRQLYFLKDSC